MKQNRKRRVGDNQHGLDVRLAVYLGAAGAMGVGVASEVQAVIVANTTVQPFGIDGNVPIDFNSDGQVDFEIDHDRIDLGGGNIVDFLQIDKNDTNGSSLGENPCPTNVFDTFEPNGTPLNNTADAGYMITGPQGSYPAALSAGDLIGPASTFDFQESDNFDGRGQTIRANRLIDEDAGQCDETLCGLTPSQTFDPLAPASFTGLGGEVRYLGLRMNLQSEGGVEYGWVGIRITDEASATGEVVGWAYETSGVPLLAGIVPVAGDYNGNGKVDAADYVVWRNNLGLMDPDATPAQGDGTGDGNVTVADYSYWKDRYEGASGLGASVHAVPEPGSILLCAMIGLILCSRHVWRHVLGR